MFLSKFPQNCDWFGGTRGCKDLPARPWLVLVLKSLMCYGQKPLNMQKSWDSVVNKLDLRGYSFSASLGKGYVYPGIQRRRNKSTLRVSAFSWSPISTLPNPRLLPANGGVVFFNGSPPNKPTIGLKKPFCERLVGLFSHGFWCARSFLLFPFFLFYWFSTLQAYISPVVPK